MHCIAIGDIHGYFYKLKRLLEKIYPYLRKETQVIFLGDYIDRGPQSKSVIDLLISFQKLHPQTIFLKGNHEDMFLGYINQGGHYGQSYLLNGGSATIQSYSGISHIPENHLHFFKSLRLYYHCPECRIVFVHAGLRPGIPINKQDPLDMLWIRDHFTSYLGEWLDIDRVVYGHTPTKDHMPSITNNKIGLDTGAGQNKRLTAMAFPEKIIWQAE